MLLPALGDLFILQQFLLFRIFHAIWECSKLGNEFL